LSQILVELDKGILTIAIDRAEKLNALNSQLLSELLEAFSEADQNADVRAIILKGTGNKAFAVGADLQEIYDMPTSKNRYDYYKTCYRLCDLIMSIEKPVIASVQGYAFGGGCLLAISCDFIIASERAKFGQQEINYGFTGGASVLPYLVGRQKAAEIVMLGKPFDAHEAWRIGLVNRVVPLESLDAEVASLARELSRKLPEALKVIKHTIKGSFNASMLTMTEFETNGSAVCMSTSESRKLFEDFLKQDQ
jgi:enoyl-CoA hydratase/carnithine racemase